MKTLLLAAALMQPAQSTELYSFNDVYRLTVAGAAMGSFPAEAGPVRVAVTPEALPVSAGFAVRREPAPAPAGLLLAGVAAAFWVARRRLRSFE